jgi:MFS family permease
MISVPWARYVFVIFLTSSDSIAYILIPPYLQDRGYDYSLIGMLVGVTGVASLGSRFPSGMLYQRDRSRLITSIALVVLGITYFSYPLADSVGLFALAQIVMGFSSGVATTVNMAMFMDTLPAHLNKHRIMAFYASAISCGHMVGSLIGGTAADAMGFTAAFHLASITTIAAVGMLWLDSFEGAPALRVRVHRASPEAESLRDRLVKTIGVFTEPKMVTISIVAFLLNFLHGIVSTFFPLYGISIGLSLSEVAILKSVHSLTNTIARPVAGWPIGKLGADRASYISLALLAALVMLIPSLSLVSVFAVVLATIGLMRAIVMVANTVALADLSEARLSRGAASGFYHSSKDLGSLSSPAICGAAASAIGLASMMVLVPLIATGLFFAGVLGLSRRSDSSRASASASTPG